jgi:hypothetical protein
MQCNGIHSVARRKSLCQEELLIRSGRIRPEMSSKDTSLNLRIRSELKTRLESIAQLEGRSVAQICEAFLQAGLVAYEKEGARYISRFLALRNVPGRDRSTGA